MQDSSLVQQTIKTPIVCEGVGLHSGESARVCMRPAPPDTGVIFQRIDVPGGPITVPALWKYVIDTHLCTMIGNRQGTNIATIEHIMAALRGCEVDNIIIEVTGPEIPAMDGSAEPFALAIEEVGLAKQNQARRVIEVIKPVSVERSGAYASLEPALRASFSFEIDFSNPMSLQQSASFPLINGTFREEISRARTFGFLDEVNLLRSMGKGLGGTTDNAIVISRDKILNTEGLRFENEFVRHKILDSIGDLYLAGAPIMGSFHSYRGGHALNNLLLNALFVDESAWCWTWLKEASLNS